jgi:hypothetical protein
VVTAICVTTSASRSVHERPPVLVIVASPLSSPTRLGRVDFSAGARPATSAASKATTDVKSTTRMSIWSANDSGMGIGKGAEMTRRMRPHASASAATPPSTARTSVSDSNC